jgi:hypothetical protein
MFEELWIIKESLCLYYKNWSQEPIALDSTLFAGFFSAFHAFQEEIFPSQFTNYIDFIHHRLLFAELNRNFFLIVRDSIYKPLNRSILQLNNLTIEILTNIESHHKLKEILFEKKNKFISLDQINPLLYPIVEQAIENLSVSDDQMNKFDLMAIIIILRDLKEILIEIYHPEIFSKFFSNHDLSWLLKEILSNNAINITNFKNISYNAIFSFMSDFLDSIIEHKVFYQKPLRTSDKLTFTNNILKYLAINRETMQKFGFTDLFISKFISQIDF